MNLTPAQAKVLKFVKSFISERGYPPTRREIADGFGWRSQTYADQCLQVLDSKGEIKLEPGRSRGIKVNK